MHCPFIAGSIPGPSRRRAGFSLLELMIAVAVVGILASIAYPSYRDYIKRGKRAAAQTVMLDLASRQQVFLLDKRRYAANLAELLPGFTVPAEISNEYTFTVAGVAGPPPTFTVTAAAKAGSIMAGDTNMTIDQAGTKTPTDYWKK